MLNRKKTLWLQTALVLMLAPLWFFGNLMIFPSDVSADMWDCMDNCLTQKHICICDECEAYSPEQCPQNPYCAVGSPIYPDCRACIQGCQMTFRACKRNCAGAPPEDILCIKEKCPPGYKCVEGSCVPKTTSDEHGKCETVTCPQGQSCDENTGMCSGPPGPIDDPCSGVKCEEGWHCDPMTGGCVPNR
jgi:hypothetical protein